LKHGEGVDYHGSPLINSPNPGYNHTCPICRLCGPQAIACHRSQLLGFPQIEQLPEAIHRQLWGHQTLYRIFSLVNGGRQVERDLFAGLR
jgi:hypothetical protein